MAEEMPIPMPASKRPIIIVCTLWAVALETFETSLGISFHKINGD